MQQITSLCRSAVLVMYTHKQFIIVIKIKEWLDVPFPKEVF